MRARKFQRILADLRTDDFTLQVPALDDYLEERAERRDPAQRDLVIAEAVRAMEEPAACHLVFQRMFGFGREIFDPVKALFHESDNHEARLFAAMLLLHHDCKDGVPLLLEEVEFTREWYEIAADTLAHKGVMEVLPLIIDWLRRCPLGELTEIPTLEHDAAVTFLELVAVLGGRLPDDVRERLAGPNAPPYVRSQVKELSV